MANSSSHPLVSIVIPVYNGSDFLAEAIESALAQTWPNIEIIVVNDGSQDGGRTAEVAARFGNRIRYFEKTNGGVATALNYGVRQMRGNYLSWLSHDDIFALDKIERMMAAVLRYDEPIVAFGDSVLVDENGEFLQELRPGRGFDERQSVWAVLESRINGCAMIVHRQCFEQCGYMHPDLPSTQDYDLWFRMALCFRFVHVPGVVVYQRQHANQGSRSERFADEVDLLWASMIDRIPQEAMTRHADSDAAFYLKALRGTPNLPGTMALIERRARALAREVPLTGITLHAGGVAETMDAVDAARSAGVRLVATVSAMAGGENWSSVALTWEDGSSLNIGTVRLPNTVSLADRLNHLCARAEGDLVRLTAEERAQIDPSSFWPALLLSRSPEAVACFLSARHGGVHGGKLGVLEGAVVRLPALRAALKQCGRGSPASLAHALSRIGPILASPTERYWRPPVETPAARESKPPAPVPPTAKTRLTLLLSRFPLLNKAVVAALWQLWGRGDKARERLLRLYGIEARVDTGWYRRRYRDVAASNLDPALHYLLFGYWEGRDPSPDFDTKAYLNEHADLSRRRVHALQHYVLWGAQEKRRIRPARPGAELFSDARSDRRPALLVVLDPNNEDMKRFARDLARQLTRRIRVLFLSSAGKGCVCLSLDEGAERGRTFHLPFEGDALRQEGDVLDVRRVLVLHAIGFDGLLQEILDSLGRPFDIVHLNREFVGGEAKLSVASPNGQQNGYHRADAALRDSERSWLARYAAGHLACSKELADFLSLRGVPVPIAVDPAPDPYGLRRFRVWARPLQERECLRIGFFGPMDEAHGLKTILAVIKAAAKDNLPLRFYFFGEVPPDVPDYAVKLSTVVPCPDMRTLTVEVCSRSPHLAWFPWQVPESCAYSVTDAESVGLPIAATSIGCLPERLHGRLLSWTLPPRSGVQDWLYLFLRLHKDGMRVKDAPANPEKRAADDQRLYEHRLIEAVFGKENIPAEADDKSRERRGARARFRPGATTLMAPRAPTANE